MELVKEIEALKTIIDNYENDHKTWVLQKGRYYFEPIKITAYSEGCAENECYGGSYKLTLNLGYNGSDNLAKEMTKLIKTHREQEYNLAKTKLKALLAKYMEG